MILSQGVLVPLLLLFTWAYLAFRPSSGRKLGLAIFDAVVITLAVALSGVAYRWVVGLYTDPNHSVWGTVMGAVSTFHVFPAVLLAGWYLRRLVFADSPG